MPKLITMSIHEAIGEKVQLAGIYAQDGAFFRAAELLREAAAICQAHAEACRAELEEMARS